MDQMTEVLILGVLYWGIDTEVDTGGTDTGGTDTGGTDTGAIDTGGTDTGGTDTGGTDTGGMILEVLIQVLTIGGSSGTNWVDSI